MSKPHDLVFNALAEPTRRSIVEMLAGGGRLTATAIAGRFAATPSAISQHLKILREAEIVLMERQGQKRIYQINRVKIRELSQWADGITKEWNERLDALDEVLKGKQV